VAAAPRDERAGPRPLRAAMPASAPTTFPVGCQKSAWPVSCS